MLRRTTLAVLLPFGALLCSLIGPAWLHAQAAREPTGETFVSADQVRLWRKQLADLSKPPRSAPEGWSKSRIDPGRLVAEFPELRIKPQYVLRAYLYKRGGNANGFVWALPKEAEFPEPADCPKLESHFLHPPKPFDALDDVMEAIAGDDSPSSYVHASLLRRALREFGAEWHGIRWGAHSVLDREPWGEDADRDAEVPASRPMSERGEWKWLTDAPRDWRPQVVWTPDRVTVRFYTYTALGQVTAGDEMEKERITLHTDVYRRRNYRALTTEKKLAEGPNTIMF